MLGSAAMSRSEDAMARKKATRKKAGAGDALKKDKARLDKKTVTKISEAAVYDRALEPEEINARWEAAGLDK